MREIKFRGKDMESGEWVYGDLRAICADGGEVTINRPYKHEVSGLRVVISTPVDPATVGQYTGLRDAKGVEIYEGDLVRTMHGVYEVVFESGAYRIKKGSLRFILVDGSCYEVVGNVHDTPELFK